jgi:branched-chain amino acid transport system ATP-binding protein
VSAVEVADLVKLYKKNPKPAVDGLSFTVESGEIFGLLGPNGAGKTTTLSAIAGTLPVWRGSVRVDGEKVSGRSPYAISRAGVVLVPEGRGIFPSLSVRENLAIAARASRGRSERDRKARTADVIDVFPRLGERLSQRAGSLSGGEQQMLALSRALLADPKVLLMDEISMGLAPLVVEQLFQSVEHLKDAGVTIVMVEQYLTYALRMADICYVLAKGRVVFCGEPAELAGDEALASTYLGAG